MEYREKEEKPELQAPGEQEKDGSVIRNPAPIGDPVIDSGEQHRFYHETLPGEVNLTELQAETPFAEWQVDTAAIPDNVNQRFRKMPTAWQLSQSGTIGTAKTTKGPSMVTFFVAIVACVVVTGALFSGRE